MTVVVVVLGVKWNMWWWFDGGGGGGVGCKVEHVVVVV